MLPKEKSKPDVNPQTMTTLIYGQPKIGKSTFCSHFPKALFIATEPGLNHLETYNVQVNSYEDLIQVFKELHEEEHDFKTLIFDTVDRLYDLIRAKVLKDLNVSDESDVGYGKGYSQVKKLFSSIIYSFANMGLGVVFISHAETKIEKDRCNNEVTKTTPTLPKRAREIIVNLVDIILYLENTVETDEQGQVTELRVIRTKGTTAYEAGDRTGKLPDTLPLDFKAYEKALMGGK